jgi:hypothetical protein
MKLKLINYSVLAAALSLISVSSAHAETDQLGRATIPFDFYAANQKMPAGTYYIRVDLTGDIINLSDASGHTVLLTGMPDGGSEDQAGLVFDHSGDSYFLREVKSDELDVRLPTIKKRRVHTESAQIPLTSNNS